MADAEEHVPVFKSLKDVYGNKETLWEAQLRYQKLKTRFFELYGHIPELYARAPGRVNLIGEHIDYEGYSVLPMAIIHDTIVAIRRQEPEDGPPSLRVVNTDAAKFSGFVFPADPFQEVDRASHHWANYFLCGYKGVFEHLLAKGVEIGAPVGYDILVDGTVPIGAGVSSSAAIVCASAIAIMAAQGLSFTKQEVAEFACVCERHIGTQAGGMDQAISIMAKRGVAKLIDFNPIRATDVALPRKGAFVIANSLTVSTKAVTAASKYNYRVVECRLAAMVLAAALGMPLPEVRSVQTLSDVEGLCVGFAATRGGAAAPVVAVEATLHEEPYGAAEIESIIQQRLTDVFAASPSFLEVLEVNRKFHLFKRARHVYTEAQRVLQFRDVVESADRDDLKLLQLGALMSQSHVSCSRMFECSCPELEELVKVCNANGALGARLTGAGWGGCVVSLVEERSVPGFIEALKKNFYQSRIDSGRIREEDLRTYVFASKPSGGAAILNL
ncbi:N-acetylgalactosamine kinase [Marchantia polymorpha subsp. ruderalis]|uniref:Galactokinase n=2 Tax=Marchantia polymorpha TaxID=3197 RepID=A0AAF6BXJ9_MARPO|nr:hypothetical protein MARPO_0068s0036 [Marchantia polymorpha]BBN16733.1 hypothetical protein Mp_7g08830 [Marchantia polymorpha subsp. ruderalis]|eukprot:PTQ35815.1 hypothetical protein MARPO_0068s0036 [Marchantia polymorpha]